ncbi:hypothetical protein [Hymenobacter convexus]|uniref:hypothetical protein n=1 Tax=Hymenobacter sp. CA1UV-4 TaxID=3063782 RepID=UPI002713B535|nr:hypothetical protein [Hymenobacter sp. CA1UV-4]MDO7851575.1 hypothetical protein [Hymenobacter sp. CA1UV-4]
MYPHDEDEALAIVAQQFPDNTDGRITPAMARTGLAGLIAHLKNQPPNFSPGADLRVRFETAAQLLAAGGVSAGDCLEGENDANFCLGMLAWVEFPLRGGMGASFRLMFDGDPARTPGDNGVWAYRTGRMVVGARLQARWVPLSDPISGVPTYDYLQTIAGAGGYDFKVGEPVRDFAGTSAEYFFAALAAGTLPAPTAAAGDLNWRRIAPEEVATVAPPFFLRISQATAIALDADEAVQSGVRYAVETGGQYVELVGTEAKRFAHVGVLNGEPVRVDIHTGAITPAGYDDTDVRGLIGGLDTRLGDVEADLVFLEQEVTDLAVTVGPLDDLRTTTKTSLVSATNEVLGRIPVAYTRLGFASDGYLTQAYATTILATKAATAFTPNYQIEVAAGATLSPGLNGGKSYTLNETNVQLDNPATDPSSYGKVDLYRVIGQRAAKLNATAPATIDGNPSVAFQPGEWFVLKQQASGHTIVMRGSTLTPTPGAGTTYTAGAGINISPQNVITATGGGGIDYVNFVAHATNTVLTVADMGKHHVFTGTGQSLWTVALPAAADVAGKLISIQVGNSASGMWELQAADIDGEPARRMWSREVALLWSNGTSWRKLGGRSIPLVLTVGFPAGNQALGGQQITTLNFTQKVSGNAPDEMLFAAGLAIRALRKGLYEPALTAYCIGSSQFRPIQAIASVNGDYGSARSVNTPCLVGADGAGLFYSSLSMASNPLALDAGDYVNIRTYTDAAIEVQNYDALRPRFSLNEVLTW